LTARAFLYAPSGSLRAAWRWIGFVLVMLVAAFVLQLLISLVYRPHGMLEAQAEGFVAFLVAVAIAHVVMLRWVDHLPWSYVWMGRAQVTTHKLGTGWVLGMLGIGVPSVLLMAGHWLAVKPAASGSWWTFALLLLAFFLPQSLAEEMMMRGYLMATAREAIGWKGALVLTSVIFGALHLANPGADVRSFVLVVLAGLFLGGIVLLTDSLYAAWMAHCAWNWTMAALLHTAVSGLPLPAPDYAVVDNGPDWLTGGVWGPEGGAGAAVGMLVMMGIFIAWRRRAASAQTRPGEVA
jgi:membrane protease YdiL (CAAX protease family)